ncbi:MAG: translocation/assembly module TamB domain-containing protein [Rectinema sp.]
MSVEGSIGKDGGYEGVVEARGIGAGSIGGLVGLKGVEGRVSGRVYGLVRGGKVSWSVSGGEYEGKVEGVGVKARVEGVGDEVGYEVKGAEVSVGGVTVGLKGKGSFKGKVFEGEVSAGGLAYGVEVTVAGERIGVKVGQTLVGGVTVAGGRVEGEVTLKDFGVGTGGGVVWLQGDVKGWYERGAWEGTVERLGVRYEGEGEYPEVLVSGTIDAKGANLAIDSIKYAGKQLKGTINVQYSSLMNPLKNMQALYSFTSIEDERAKIEGTVQALEGKITAAITGTSIPIEQFLSSSSNIAGDVQFQGTASISATGGKLSWADISLAELKFNCQKAEIKGIPFSAAGTISLKDNALSIHSGAFSYQNYKIDNIEAMYDLSKQKLEYALNAKIVIAEKLLSAFLKGTGDINGSIFDKEAFKNAQFSGEITEAKFESTVLDPITYVFSIADNNLDIHFSQANGDNAHASIRNMTEFELTIANLFNVNGSARGTIQANNIEADINLDSMDLSLLQIFLPQEDIKDISGNGSASMHLSGDISDPKIDGKILLNSVSFSSNAYLLEKVGPFNAEITINEGIIELSPTIVSIGTGNISVAATASLARWAIGDIKAFVSTGETASVKFKGTIAGLTAKDISLKADIKANISQSKLEISGNILLDNGILEVNPAGFIASGDTGQAAQPLSLNLAVTLGKNVELYIPSQDIPLVRGMSSPNSALTILYDQASGALSVNGKVELRSGYVLYLLRNFFIKQCSIDFSENQTKFNPLISTTAELREPSKDGIITITLSADRTPFENFNPRLSSIPPKSETELLALLGGGLALSDLADNNPLTLREAVIAGSEFLTQNSLFRSFEQRVQKALGVDVLYIQSSFIQRWLLDITDQTKSGQTPLSEYLTGTELFAGKYITDLAFAHFSLRMVQDPLEGTGPLQLDSELGLELQAPFGLLQWSMSLGKEGTPLNNQTLSLSWRINY